MDESLHGMPYYHLWYAYMQIVLTLSLALLASFAFRVPRWVVVLTGVIFVMSPRWTGTDGWCAIILGIGYAFLGMVIYPCLRGRVSINWAIVTMIIALFLSAWGGMAGLKALGFGSMSYASPFVFGSSVCLFISISLMPDRGGFQFISRIAKMTFGVYLIHPLVKFVPGIFKKLFPATDVGAFSYAVFSFLLVFVGSVVLVEIVGRCKKLIKHKQA